MLVATQTDISPLAALHQNQQLRLKALDLVKALFEQVRVVQQHRAATNGALAGNPFFESKARLLAREVNARFRELERALKLTHELFDGQQWSEICSAWQTVHLQWRQDEVIENFELHSHLVRQMLRYIAGIGRQAEDLIQTNFQHKALSQYVFEVLPCFIELVGQIRALGTSACASGKMDGGSEMRLKYLMTQLLTQKGKVNEQAKGLSKEALEITGSLIDALLCEPKLERLSQMVQQDLLTAGDINTSADDIFTLSTAVIDAHFNVMNEGLRLLRLNMDKRMQAWVSR
ncbi:MAG: nitrate- and nitrite sensing domain-containing protein [Bermanella sp.]